MKKRIAAILTGAALLVGGAFSIAEATPSTHIWSPSADVQAYGVFHLTSDMYVPAKKDEVNKARPNTVTNLGLTTGVLPYEKANLEVGFDHIAGYGTLDAHPIYFNAKLGVPENAFGEFFPQLAVGGYMLGTKTDLTNYNIYYGKLAKTIGKAGKLSLGYYTGNKKLLLDENGKEEKDGALVCWERTMSEISDNLWLAVDYMGGKSSYGTVSYGAAWKFAPNTSVIFAYVNQLNDKIAGVADTVTVQVDIDFNVFGK